MADLQTQIKTDIALIKADVASLHTKTSSTLSWMRGHMILIVPACLVIGWVLGKTF